MGRDGRAYADGNPVLLPLPDAAVWRPPLHPSADNVHRRRDIDRVGSRYPRWLLANKEYSVGTRMAVDSVLEDAGASLKAQKNLVSAYCSKQLAGLT